MEGVVVTVKTVEVTGVRFDRKAGVDPCPYCKAPMGKVYRTKKWDGGVRERYHVCRRCGQTFKSVEEE